MLSFGLFKHYPRILLHHLPVQIWGRVLITTHLPNRQPLEYKRYNLDKGPRIVSTDWKQVSLVLVTQIGNHKV